MVKGIIFDYDETLYSHELKFVPNLTLKTLRKLKEKGIKLALCTSREQFELNDLDKDCVAIMDLIVSGNGSTIIKDNQVIEKNTISSIATKTIIDYLDKNNIPYHYSDSEGNVYFFNKFPEGLLEEFYRGNLSEFVFKEYEDEKLLNILAYFPNEKQKEEISLLTSEVSSTSLFCGPQLAKKGIDKGYGVRKFMEIFNLTKEETISVGDALSDIPMFKETAVSISTIDASEEVKFASTHIMPLTIEEGGLNRLLIKLGIIEKEPYDIKIFFLDVDNTIYDHSIREIRDTTLEALKQLKEKGYILFINSGRSYDEVKGISQEVLDLMDGMILSNGANYIIDEKHYFKPIDIEASKPLTDFFLKRDMFFRYVTIGNKTYYRKEHERAERLRVYYQNSFPIKEYEGEQLIQFVFYNSDESLEDEIAYLSKGVQRTKISSGNEIARKGVTKATTMLKVTELLGLKPENICAFGDSNNDTEMLKAARLSVAMGNGCFNCKKAATFICPDIKEDGFARALKHFNFID
ncbi:MAG: HAD family hydrolase [Bacillota bacterium]|jgi:Cof subfamily protein (haloacid dehalogenase superfamily)|nr:HAD family hydrolase [Bacillota bacterium]NLL26870.1 HAD family phosphatase [Erysipelotrichia bacterium]